MLLLSISYLRTKFCYRKGSVMSKNSGLTVCFKTELHLRERISNALEERVDERVTVCELLSEFTCLVAWASEQ